MSAFHPKAAIGLKWAGTAATDPKRSFNQCQYRLEKFNHYRFGNVKDIRWKDTMEAVGIVSIVASLVFVGLEVQQSGRAANDASLASDASIVAEVESLVITYPDVWRRGCLGEDLEPTEALIFAHIHHTYVFQYFLRWVRDRKGLDVSSALLSIDNLAMNIYRNPGFAREWNNHGASRHQVPKEVDLEVFRRLVNERVAEYPSFEPTPLDFASRCGLN